MEQNVGSSETIRKITNLQASPHKPRTRKPSTRKEIGSFLAGLIDGNGQWGPKPEPPELVIKFHRGEGSLAHNVKSCVGYGRVRQVKGKEGIVYVCAHRDGLRKIASLCAPYLRHPERCAHFHRHTLPLLGIPPGTPFSMEDQPPLEGLRVNSHSFDWWIAGFFVALGEFHIRLLDKPSRPLEVRFLLRIDEKDRQPLDFIKSQLGGSICVREHTYSYVCSSYKNAVNWIHYLDRAFLMGMKMTTYVIWRRAFLLVQEKRHLTPAGEQKLRRMCHKIRELNVGGKLVASKPFTLSPS